MKPIPRRLVVKWVVEVYDEFSKDMIPIIYLKLTFSHLFYYYFSFTSPTHKYFVFRQVYSLQLAVLLSPFITSSHTEKRYIFLL